MNLQDLATYVEVVRQNGFTRAGSVLGVPKSTVSRRVARLEEDLGVPLLHRRHRSFDVTAEGRRLYERSVAALLEIDAASRTITDRTTEPAGLLRITAPRVFGSVPPFVRTIAAFRRRYPLVELEIELSSRLADLHEEGIDVALRVHLDSLADRDDLLTKRVMLIDGTPIGAAGIVASPAYLAQAPPLEHPRDLSHHACLSESHPHFRKSWRLRREGEPEHAFVVNTVVASDDQALLLELTLAGLGLSIGGRMAAGEYFDSGRLVRVLPAWSLPQPMLSLVWRRTRHLAPSVRAFIDHLT